MIRKREREREREREGGGRERESEQLIVLLTGLCRGFICVHDTLLNT